MTMGNAGHQNSAQRHWHDAGALMIATSVLCIRWCPQPTSAVPVFLAVIFAPCKPILMLKAVIASAGADADAMTTDTHQN